MGDQYEYGKRIKALAAEENAMLQKEVKLAKESAAKAKLICKLHKKCVQHYKWMNLYQDWTEKLASYNMKLKQFTNDEEQRMKEQEESNKCLQENVQAEKCIKESQRRKMIECINNLRMMKQSTGVFINPYKLPGLLQGVKLCEKSNSTKLVTFNVVPMQITMQELQDFIWSMSENDENTNSRVWKELLFEQYLNDPTVRALIDGALLNEYF